MIFNISNSRKITGLSIFLIALFLFARVAVGGDKTNAVYPQYLVVADKIDTVFGVSTPTNFVNTVDSKEKIIFFYASVRIMNPTKKKYKTRIVCVDSQNNVIIEGTALQPLQRASILGKDRTNSIDQTLGLNPKPDAMVPGQKRPLQDGGEYFVKLYVEGELVSITNFRYVQM